MEYKMYETNKEVLETLESFLMTQSHEVVVKLAANAFIDLNRFLNFEELPKDEQQNLMYRTAANIKEIYYILSLDKEKRSNIEIVSVATELKEENGKSTGE